jgi:hypothetical protein
MTVIRTMRRAWVAVSLLVFAGCNFFDVSNPGPIDDSNLNEPDAMTGLVTGMSFDLSRAMNDVTQETNIMADDLYHGGSYTDEGLYNRGIIRFDGLTNTLWGSMQRARWVAEAGIERMKTVLGTGYDTSPLAARANIYAGLANRLLGENVCEAVIDGGAPEDFKVHFSRADAQFTEAIRIANSLTGALKDSLLRVAYGGRASVRAWQGKWTEAAADAALVPTSYVFVAPFSTNTTDENNDLAFETTTRFEYTVYNTQWAQNNNKDARVPWDTVRRGSALAVGQDGRTIFFQQKKYPTLASDVPLVKGTEMLMLRAEAALRNNDVAGAMALINQERAFYNTAAAPLPPLTATSLAQAWPILEKERAAVIWMEARRFWDLRRWLTEPPPIQNNFLANRDKCIPVSQNEVNSNPNLRNR